MKYKKCKHNKCKRKALEDGYCDKCIGLNTREYIDRKNKLRDSAKKQVEEINKKTYEDAIRVLIENKIDLNRLDIRIKK